MKPIVIVLIIGLNCFALGQKRNQDSILTNRFIVSNVLTTGFWAGSLAGLQVTWYKNAQTNNFQTFNDASNWMQMDKAGHIYTTIKLSQLTSDWYKWSGVKTNKAILYGSIIGFGYQTTIELFDGFSKNWGFSWSDMGANFLGASSYYLQEKYWGEQKIISKFSYHPTSYAAIRPEVLGHSSQERLLKDYNGQTYWLSFSPGHFQRLKSIPKWICVSIGYSIDQKLVGDQDAYLTYNARREFLFSLDIDFTQFKPKRKWIGILLKQLNYVKIPFPTLNYSAGKLNFYGLYF